MLVRSNKLAYYDSAIYESGDLFDVPDFLLYLSVILYLSVFLSVIHLHSRDFWSGSIKSVSVALGSKNYVVSHFIALKIRLMI